MTLRMSVSSESDREHGRRPCPPPTCSFGSSADFRRVSAVNFGALSRVSCVRCSAACACACASELLYKSSFTTTIFIIPPLTAPHRRETRTHPLQSIAHSSSIQTIALVSCAPKNIRACSFLRPPHALPSRPPWTTPVSPPRALYSTSCTPFLYGIVWSASLPQHERFAWTWAAPVAGGAKPG